MRGGDKLDMFRNRLVKVYRHRGKQARSLSVSCFRVYDHDLPEFPFCIEIYGDRVHVAEYKRRHHMTEGEHEQWLEQSMLVVREVLGVNADHLFLKVRQRKPGRLGQYQKLDQQKHEFLVEENGLRFIVNLADYLDTGLFLDHRVTRQMTRELSAGKRILNLFCYTGSFSVYAAAGGASEVVSVDLSKTYLEWAKRNMRLNGFEDEMKYRYVQADVKTYLKHIPRGHYDLVVLDPPTFSNSQRMEDFLDIQRDHVALIQDCLEGLSSGGVIFFSTNFSKFRLEEERIPQATIKDITSATTPFDFAGKLDRYCFRISHK
jgi:23S rRNA (cytosine1962-C5)-methyltransferase